MEEDVKIRILHLLNCAEAFFLRYYDIIDALHLDSETLTACLNSLESEYHLIVTDKNGVHLKNPIDFLDEKIIYKSTKTSCRVKVLDCVDSTNTFMIKNIDKFTDGDTLIAELQTKGRGRRGDIWFSGVGKQITFSLMKSFKTFESLEGLSIGIGVAIAKAIEEYSLRNVFIKWPNDIYYDDAKIGGILIETVPYKGIYKVVIGIGVDVYDEDFKDLKSRCGAIFSKKPEDFSRNALCATIIDKVNEVCAQYMHNDREEVMQYFGQHNLLLGRKVRVENEQGSYYGTALGISNKGELLLNVGDLTIMSFSSGHISFID